ncbi:hypothetical protein Tco_0233234 [Tanacetum coccineum]
MIKGLADSTASASNLRDIQVRDIVKEVEIIFGDIYSPAEWLSAWIINLFFVFKTNQDPNMSGTVPPIPPPFGANTGNPSSPIRAVEEDLMSQMSLSLMKMISLVGKIALEGEKVNGTFTRLRILLNDLENNGVSIPQAEVNATFVNSLPRKWLSMNQTQRANNSIKNDTLAALYGKYNYEEGGLD